MENCFSACVLLFPSSSVVKGLKSDVLQVKFRPLCMSPGLLLVLLLLDEGPVEPLSRGPVGQVRREGEGFKHFLESYLQLLIIF